MLLRYSVRYRTHTTTTTVHSPAHPPHAEPACDWIHAPFAPPGRTHERPCAHPTPTGSENECPSFFFTIRAQSEQQCGVFLFSAAALELEPPAWRSMQSVLVAQTQYPEACRVLTLFYLPLWCSTLDNTGGPSADGSHNTHALSLDKACLPACLPAHHVCVSGALVTGLACCCWAFAAWPRAPSGVHRGGHQSDGAPPPLSARCWVGTMLGRRRFYIQ